MMIRFWYPTNLLSTQSYEMKCSSQMPGWQGGHQQLRQAAGHQQGEEAEGDKQ